MVNKLGKQLTDPIETWLYERHLKRKEMFKEGIISLESDGNFFILKVNGHCIESFYKHVWHNEKIKHAIVVACETIRSLNYDNR